MKRKPPLRTRGRGWDRGSWGKAYLWARAKSVEHVEEDKAGEGHGGVPRSDDIVLQLNTHTLEGQCPQYMGRKICHRTGSDPTHLPPEDEERAADDYECRQQHLDQQAAGDDAVLDVARGLPDDIAVHRLHPKTDTRENSILLAASMLIHSFLFETAHLFKWNSL